MSKRVLWAVVPALLLCLALPSTALAKGHVHFNGVKAVYAVAAGKNLKVVCTIHGDQGTTHWNDHGFFEIEKRVKGSWVDLTDDVKPSNSGKFSATLSKPSTGLYRVNFDGCEHFHAASKEFLIKRPKQVKKLDPLLSVNSAQILLPQASPANSSIVADSVATVPCVGVVHTGRSPSTMSGLHLRIQALASLSGATYTVVYTDPTLRGFSGSQNMTAGPVPVPQRDSSGNWYSYFKIKAAWLGNAKTKPGSATSSPVALLR